MVDFQMRIENERGGGLLFMQPIAQAVEEGGLARPYFARKQDETLAGLDPVCHFVQRLPGLRGQEEVSGIRVDVERIFVQSKKMFVHVRLVGFITAFFFAARIWAVTQGYRSVDEWRPCGCAAHPVSRLPGRSLETILIIAALKCDGRQMDNSLNQLIFIRCGPSRIAAVNLQDRSEER